MGRSVLITVVTLLLLAGSVLSADNPSSSTADSQSMIGGGRFGQLSTAEAVPPGAIDAGANVGFYDHTNVMFGHFRMGIVTNTDFDVKLGIDDTEQGDDPHFMIGMSVKSRIISREDYYLPDLAISGFAEYYDTGEHSELWMLGTGLIGSYPIEVNSYINLTPYGRLNFRAERLTQNGYKDTDFDIGLNLGTRYTASDRMQFYGEFQIDDQWGFLTGINFAIF
jgi:hypothetical protein